MPRHPFRRKNLSARLLPCYAVAGAGLYLAEPTPAGLALGGVLVAAGAGLRLWAAGHLVKTQHLTLNGPYAHLRHPLYAGTLLLAVGFAVVAGPRTWPLLAAAFLPAFFLLYLPRKERLEGERLAARYGEVYRLYRSAVPALLPARGAWRPPASVAAPAPQPWSRERVHENHELGVQAGVAAGLLLLALRPLVG